ncbi:MAG: hypothetical protein LQ349_001961 [Xanthoria aureola]|nr:MAG: hypothetical protein LQ349_001961 [Xanthoria aureola]
MATLNTSTNGQSISKSYQSIVNAPALPASKSATYGQWAVFSVSAPLANAFQPDAGAKESVLKVQNTGDGDLTDLIDEFSDGRVQFAFVRVKDPNTTLPKFVLLAWCGEGVPERTKGYFPNHLAAVSKVLHGYHFQITARSDRDLTPESIVQKVADASGSKYTNSSSAAPSSGGPPPPTASKPVFTPTQSSRGTGGFNPLASSRSDSGTTKVADVDKDGWGQDAPPVTRTGLEKVQSSYQPTKVNMRELSSQNPEQPSFNHTSRNDEQSSDVVRGGYQPVGKVDIAALRRQAQEGGTSANDRPNVVKGAYEPVGKVDIAAIKARAQQPSEGESSSSLSALGASARSNDRSEEQESLPDRSAPFTSSERMTSLPKPKVANRFGGGSSNFTGTKAPTPGGFGLESRSTPTAPHAGVGKTFADQGGKTPAQVWAEKKARERGLSGASDTRPPPHSGTPASPIANQTSGGGEWKSGYAGKSWAPVQTTRTGQSASSVGEHRTGEEDRAQDDTTPPPAGGISAIRDRFKDAPPMGAASTSTRNAAPSPPPLDTSNKPNAGRGIPIPGLSSRPPQLQSEDEEENRMPTPPAQPPRSPTPPTPPAMDSGSPIRVAMPVGRGQESASKVEDAREEQFSPPPTMPTRSLAQQIPAEKDLTDEPSGHDPARAAGKAAGVASFEDSAAEAEQTGAKAGGKRAVAQFDYDKAEDNEIDLREGEYVTNIDMVDTDWWMGENARGEVGLFPSNYVEAIEDDDHAAAATSTHASAPVPTREPEPEPTNSAGAGEGHTATALYDYDAAEDNELSFPENAKITGIEFPDDDWWSGEYKGKQGLFPANYVQLDH